MTTTERAVKLDHLPPGLAFPVELRDRVWFDADRKRLVFRGVMGKNDYDRLMGLDNDVKYMDAIQALFIQAAFQPVKERSWFGWMPRFLSPTVNR